MGNLYLFIVIIFIHWFVVFCDWLLVLHVPLVSLSVIGCQSVSHDASGRMHLTCLEYAGDSTLYVGTSRGQVSAWDTRQNTCFMHWLADTDSTREIGFVTFTVIFDGHSSHQ